MKSVLIGLLYTIMARFIGGGFMRRMTYLVEAVADEDISGATKRDRVLAALSEEAKTLGTVAVNAALEIVVLKLRDAGKA
jgi:hypothetical protein